MLLVQTYQQLWEEYCPSDGFEVHFLVLKQCLSLDQELPVSAVFGSCSRVVTMMPRECGPLPTAVADYTETMMCC